MSVLQKTSKELPFDQFYLLPEHLNRYPRSQYPLFRSQIGKPLRLISIVGGLSGKPGHVNNVLEQRAFNVDQFALIVTLIFGGKKWTIPISNVYGNTHAFIVFTLPRKTLFFHTASHPNYSSR